MISISEFLIHAVEKNASDLFITAGKKPAFRIQGEIVTDPRFRRSRPETSTSSAGT